MDQVSYGMDRTCRRKIPIRHPSLEAGLMLTKPFSSSEIIYDFYDLKDLCGYYPGRGSTFVNLTTHRSLVTSIIA